MTALFVVYQNTEKHNTLKNNTLHKPSKISIFAHNFSETSKHSILRASGSRNFNTCASHSC